MESTLNSMKHGSNTYLRTWYCSQHSLKVLVKEHSNKVALFTRCKLNQILYIVPYLTIIYSNQWKFSKLVPLNNQIKYIFSSIQFMVLSFNKHQPPYATTKKSIFYVTHSKTVCGGGIFVIKWKTTTTFPYNHLWIIGKYRCDGKLVNFSFCTKTV